MAVEDVFMHLRSQHEEKIYRRKQELANKGEKVVNRNCRRYATMVYDRWKMTNVRRQTHNETGFFSPFSLPYKNFGKLSIIDVYDLLGDYLGIDISKHQAYVQRYMVSRLHHQPRPLTASKNAGRPNTIEVWDISRNKYRALPLSPTAGLDLLSSKIGSDKRILHDVRACSSLLQTLQREEHRQYLLKAIKAPKIIYRGEVKVTINKTYAYLPPMLPTASSKICLLSDPPMSMVDPSRNENDPSRNENAPTKEMLDPDSDPEAVRKVKGILRKNFLAKLKSIYSILCCLHNMNTKDLRSYEPLPFYVVKDLCKRLLHTTIVHRPYIGQLNHLHLDRYHQRCHQARTQTSKPSRLLSPISAHPNFWEDLLDMDLENLQSRSSHSLRTPRALPAWKRKIITIEQRDKKSFGLEMYERKMTNSIRAFRTLKNEVADKLRILLDHNNMMQGKSRSLKMKYFQCGPIMEKSLKEMRDKSYRIRWEEGEEDFNHPEWFVHLAEEMKEIFVDEESVTDVCKVAMDGLKQFLYLDTCKIPLVIGHDASSNIKEKLCLLSMSVPANYLCIYEVIKAFEFVCEHVLKISPELIKTLRDIRKLPALADLQPLDYLFGHPITA